MPNEATTNTVSLKVNGRPYRVEVGPGERLLDLLRDRLGLMGAKEGCGSGECGACTVLLDGEAVNACMVAAASVDGQRVLTIEGLEGPHGELHPIQQAYIDAGAVQCGFCTPGMIMSTVALLDQNPEPSDQQIKQALSGNLCRCTGYIQIIEAVHGAAREIAAARSNVKGEGA
jgi:carbon-monoxide dehydrogenase small subunit